MQEANLPLTEDLVEKAQPGLAKHEGAFRFSFKVAISAVIIRMLEG